MRPSKASQRKQTITTKVSRIPGTSVAFRLGVRFDPAAIGPERTDQIWQGFAMILKGVLEPEEIGPFMVKFQRRIEAARKRAAKCLATS